MTKKHIIAIVLKICFISFSLAQKTELNYSEKLTISEGLAHNGVTSILEDSSGFIWFGTYAGINKYDGYELRTFKNTIDQDVLTSNRVRTLREDKKENIWIGTDQGVTIYNHTAEKFEKLISDKLIKLGFNTSIIRDIIINEANNQVLCITQGNGVFVFSDENFSLIGQFKYQNSEIEYASFFKGISINKSNYLITTSVGLLNFNSKTKEFTRVLENDIQYCNSIIQLNENSFLVTLLNGVAIIEGGINSSKSDFEFKHKNFEDYQFNSALLDSSGKLWLGTLSDGVFVLNNAEAFRLLETKAYQKFTDNLPILRSSYIVETSHNNCWLATFNEGIYRFDVNTNSFFNYNITMNDENGIGSNNVTHITALDKDRVYMTSSIGGLALFNTNTKTFESLPFLLPKTIASKVTSVFVDSKKNTWLKIDGEDGLRRHVKGKKTVDIVEQVNFSTRNDLILRSFTEDKYGNIWIGTSNSVYKISIGKDNEILKTENLNSNPYFQNNKLSLARYVYADPLHDYIWIGADSEGLFRVKNNPNLSINQLKINQYTNDKSNTKSISSNFVTSILRLPNESLWVGTESGGICKVLESNTEPKFINYTEKNGLSNNVVKSILYDDNNNLWISTNIGLNEFNTQKNEFRKFNESDGLAFEDFWFAANQIENGTMVLSGLDGFIYFNPNEITKSEKLPEIQLENFKIFNKIIQPGDTINKRILLSKAISKSEAISLKHNENVFSIDVTSLHFLNPKNHNLKYRLLPINEEWIEVPSNQKTISYSGLQPGEYVFSAMASNSLNDWTLPKTLNIEIKPSIWNTKWAYLLYSLLGLLLAYIVVRIILKIQKLNHKVEIEQLEKDKVEEVNEAKLRFFANISHEIKTPLTLISRPIDILSQRFKGNPDISEKVNLVKRQSKKIQQLIEQVQDFRKADVNMLKMTYSRFNFNAFIQDLILDFQFLADNDQKTLEFVNPDNNIIVSADKDKLEKIFNNLLNNAFKYTSTNDTIKVEFEQDGGKDLIVSVSDTGRGIDNVDIAHIFERFYQSQRKENKHISGSGIGLAFSKRLVEMHYGFINAESKLNKGTKIIVRLPIVKKHLPTDKLEDIKLPKEEEIPFNSAIIQEHSEANIVASGEFPESVIFYAEDNLEMRNFVSNLLSKYFIVKSFRNGRECAEAIEDEWPDIVISDVQMPEMNGLDLCQKIKSDLKTSHIPVILLTALTNIEDHLQGIRDGADAYIKKPFNVNHLITNVEALLTIRKQLRERYQVGIPLTKENNKNNRNDNAFLEKLYSLLEENLDNQEFDLNSLARELYLNRTHFYQKVKVLTNQTPFELLKIYRLKKAAELLAQKGLSVNEVFMMTGFKSRTHFTKIFKEKYETSPGKYALESEKKYTD